MLHWPPSSYSVLRGGKVSASAALSPLLESKAVHARVKKGEVRALVTPPASHLRVFTVASQAPLQTQAPPFACIYSFPDTTAIKIHQSDAVASLPQRPGRAHLDADWPKMESNNNQRVQ